ncbi:hypothetical protein [Pseudooceanicola marinus]|uniref:hypothetical protein n=1 Tax=Pseudooceanicola marinus TaxID=396013 RepID=UPI001CD7DF4C|nr:hypothetical protein [Pseudooceanicola marinus]MCA1335593.1 hypothetical protein [Pseudooceanicola marinus]
MCALCGILGGDDHWSDAVPRAGVYTRRDGPQARRAEAARRAKVLNAVLASRGLKFRDWQGQYILQTLTGQTQVLSMISHVWAEGGRMTGRPMDPLDPAWLARIEDAVPDEGGAA